MADICNQDISKIMQIIYHSKLRLHFLKEIDLLTKIKWPQILEPGEYRIPGKNHVIRFITNRSVNLHILNIFRSKQELKGVQEIMGLYFALKISQELHFSCTTKQIMSHGTTKDGITYCNTRFGNVYEAREDHSQQFLATLQDHGLESHILMISPFSHKNNFYTFNRP